MTVRLFADSASDLPLEFLTEKNVTLFPLVVLLDGKEYEDLLTIKPIDVFNAMKEGKVASTSQVSPHHFKEEFTKLAKEGVSGIYIAFSSELSGTCQTAMMVKAEVQEEYPNLDLTIIDTKCASLGVGLVIKTAVELLEKGATKEEILEGIQFSREHMEHIFTVDNLDYLARGGRISKASAFVGGLLNIKPLLHVEDGKLIPLEKIRGSKKVLKRIVELAEERGVNLNEQTIAISHADAEDTALELKRQLEEKFGTTSFFINSIGSAIGAHVGPGTMAVFFLNKSR